GFLDACNHQRRRRVAERGEDAAGVEPADPELAEDVVPIEVARFELAGRGISAIGNPHCAAHAKAAFGEVEAVADDATDTIKRHPPDELGIDAPLQNEFLDEPA